MKPIKILHLTDLHFKAGEKRTQRIKREKALHGLVDKLGGGEQFASLTAIVVSGDIAYFAEEEDYDEAKVFFEDLFEALGLDEAFIKQRVIICPGNHDVLRARLKPHHNIHQKSLNQVLNFDGKALKEWSDLVFQYYNDFCEDIGVEVYDNGGKTGFYTCGVRILEEEKICFMTLNSSWLCLGEWEEKDKKGRTWLSNDYGRLIVGRDIVLTLEDYLIKQINLDDYLKVVVLHHPPGWLRWEEKFNNADNDYLPALDAINRFADLVFCGHEHGEVKDPVLLNDQALWITGGSTYSRGYDEKAYRNNLSMVTIDRERQILDRQPFNYLPGRFRWEKGIPGHFLLGNVVKLLQKLFLVDPSHYDFIIKYLNSPDQRLLTESLTNGENIDEADTFKRVTFSPGQLATEDFCKNALRYLFSIDSLERFGGTAMIFRDRYHRNNIFELVPWFELSEDHFDHTERQIPSDGQYVLVCFSVFDDRAPWHVESTAFEQAANERIRQIEHKYKAAILAKRLNIIAKLFTLKEVKSLIIN